MKRLFINMLFLAIYGTAMSQTLSIDDVEVLPGGTASYTLKVNVGNGVYSGFQYSMQFPATGFSTTENTTVNSNWQNGSLTVGTLESGAANASGISTSNAQIPSGDIEIGSVEFSVDNKVTLGEYNVTISAFEFLSGDVRQPVANVTFKVKVVNALTVVLDENSTTAPEAAEGVNAKVKRTISANNWNTICLPFAMTAEQVTTAFGNDVQLGDFNGIEATYDGDNCTNIKVNFNEATAIEANHPYIIKVSSAINEFTVDGVNIVPTEERSVNKDKKDIDVPYIGKISLYNKFIGTYDINTIIPKNKLFLKGNKFYYSDGTRSIKAFRAYFDFYEVLADVANANSSMMLFITDETTGITNIERLDSKNSDSYYDLQGRRIEKPSKGLYIHNGRKVVIK